MKLVIDANILVRELLRKRGQELLKNPQLILYIAQKALDETNYELKRRLNIIISQGRLDKALETEILTRATELRENYITPVPLSVYAELEIEAKKRIPRDPNDWETVALSLALSADIWTEDQDFFGCGCPTWTTETLLLQMGIK